MGECGADSTPTMPEYIICRSAIERLIYGPPTTEYNGNTLLLATREKRKEDGR